VGGRAKVKIGSGKDSRPLLPMMFIRAEAQDIRHIEIITLEEFESVKYLFLGVF
jgi:hypothetical protein